MYHYIFELITLHFFVQRHHPVDQRFGARRTARNINVHRHHFIHALQEIPVAPSVTVNSIVAVEGDGPVAEGDDGVVKYSSAHIEPVESELVVKSSHSTQGNPHTIEEVRRILRLHVGLKPATVTLEPK